MLFRFALLNESMGSAPSSEISQNAASNTTSRVPNAVHQNARLRHFPQLWNRKRLRADVVAPLLVVEKPQAQKEVKETPEQEAARKALEERTVNAAEVEEWLSVSAEISDIAFVAASAAIDADYEFSEGSSIAVDTFITITGKSFSCFKDASGKWFYIDWEKQSNFPILLPSEWKRAGGYFLSTDVKESKHANRHPLSSFQVSSASVCVSLNPSSRRRVISHLFPLLRLVRCYFNDHSQRWLPMPLEMELVIPSVEETIELMEHRIRQNQVPLKYSRQEILMTLRDYGYNVDAALEALINLPEWEYSQPFDMMGTYVESLETPEEPLDFKGLVDRLSNTDSAISLNPVSLHYCTCGRVVPGAAFSTTTKLVRHLREHALELQDKLEYRNNQLIQSMEKISKLQFSETSLRIELDQLRQQSRPIEENLKATSAALLDKSRIANSLSKQVDMLRMMRLDLLPGLPGLILDQKDSQIGRLVSSTTNLRKEIETAKMLRNRDRRLLVDAWKEISDLKINYIQLCAQTQTHFDSMLRSISSTMRQFSEKLAAMDQRAATLYAEVLAERRASRLLKSSMTTGVEWICRICPDGRRSKSNDIDALSILGDSSVLVTPMSGELNKPQLVEFDAAFGPATSQETLYSACIQKCIVDCLNGISLRVLALGPESSGKTTTIKGDEEHPGLLFHTVRDLITLGKEARDRMQATFSFTCLEVYREKVYDLLSDRSADLAISKTLPVVVHEALANVITI
ncbi:hypothetical protein BC830DRAFT_592 [Chytriomyces sp. MP71]|nr:hypothetical protein BC830DRAFT_592 [Chytriomyces sp. MP71]